MSEKPDKIAQISAKTDAVKGQLQDNISDMLARGEKLEDIQVKAETLENQSQTYEKKAKEVKDVMCWQSYRNLIIIFVILAIIGLVIGLSIWGATKK